MQALFGKNRSVLPLSLPSDKDESFDIAGHIESILEHIPGGLDIIGVMGQIKDEGIIRAWVARLARAYSTAQVVATVDTEGEIRAFKHDTSEIVVLTMLSPSSLITLRTKIPVVVDLLDPAQVEEMCARLESENIFFYMTSRMEGGVVNRDATATVSRFRGSGGSKQQKNTEARLDLLQLTSAWRNPTSTTVGSAPILQYSPSSTRANDEFFLDVLTITNGEESVGTAVRGLQRTAARHLRIAARIAAAAPSSQLRARHFFVPQYYPVAITNLTNDLVSEEVALEQRQRVHAILGLPPNIPLIRPSQLLYLDERAPQPDRLKNVHLGLPSPKIGSQHIVSGDYLYYHYMQDKFNDDGWGCAYRSLQTLISWFQCHHYFDIPVPSIPEIQAIIVKSGDKPKSFQGSKQWIGATEVAIVLDAYLGVTSKIMHLPSGHEIGDHGRELAAHFDTQGTPVMVGGGVLAYTLLGIDYNESTGDMRLLILDPHYTGRDDLKPIQEKKWVGWHEIQLLRQDAFYNLCMPQRPQVV